MGAEVADHSYLGLCHSSTLEAWVDCAGAGVLSHVPGSTHFLTRLDSAFSVLQIMQQL